MTVGPVTIGGKILCSVFGGKKEIRISVNAQIAQVPMRAPYASGQGSRLPGNHVRAWYEGTDFALTIGIQLTIAVCVHLRKSSGGNWNDGKGRAHN